MQGPASSKTDDEVSAYPSGAVLRARPVDVVNLVGVGNADRKVTQQAVLHAVDESMHREWSTGRPGVLHDGRVADVSDLFDHVELAQPLPAPEIVANPIELMSISRIDVLDIPEPVVN